MALDRVTHWRRVLNSVVNAMIPTAALLRFGINDGKGRSIHTFIGEDHLPVFSSDNHEGSSSRFSTKNEVGTSIEKSLSFLSCVAAHFSNNDDMRLASRAAAGHLVENILSFNDLVSLWVVENSCNAIRGLSLTLLDNETQEVNDSARSLIENALTLFVDDGDDDTVDEFNLPTIPLSASLEYEKKTAILACLGAKNIKAGRIVGNPANLELTEMLIKCDVSPFDNDEGWGSLQEELTKLLLHLLCGKVPIGVRARAFVAQMLCSLLDADAKLSPGSNAGEIVAMCAANSIDQFPKEDIQLMVRDLTSLPTRKGEREIIDDDMVFSKDNQMSEKTARVISHIVSISRKGLSGKGCRIILHELLLSIDQWARCPSQKHLVNLLCLLASRFDELNNVGKKIALLLTTKEGSAEPTKECVMTARDFFEFTSILDRLVNQPPPMAGSLPATKITAQRASDVLSGRVSAFVTLKSGEQVPRTCSFVETGEGFTEQHWYNCYTCGLLWDKVS